MLIKVLVLSALVALASAQADYEKICGNRPGNPYFFAKDPSNCQTYYLCRDNVATQDRCPYGFLFNEEKALCDYAENVVCTAPIPPQGPVGCPPTGRTNVPIPGSCKKYIFCADGLQFQLECANGTLFDENYRICKDEKLAFCNDCPVDDSNAPVFVPDRRDCRRYYFCNRRVRYLQMCSRRLYFDEKAADCKNTCDGTAPYKCPVSI